MAGTDRAQAGLTSAQAAKLLEQYGKNELTSGKKGQFLRKALHILGEPMFLLLFFAAVVYFILGEPKDGAVMFIFITGVVGIDVMQEWKTDRTLAALQKGEGAARRQGTGDSWGGACAGRCVLSV